MKNKKINSILIVILIVLGGFCNFLWKCNWICIVKAEFNYIHNVKVWNDYNYGGIINDQSDFEKLNYGFGNISSNGCGAVAVYNILKMENKNPYFPDTIKQFDLCGENVFGHGGSNPFRVMTVLKNAGMDINYTINKNNFESVAKNSKYAIYLYLGIEEKIFFGHYQLMLNFDGTKFETINISGHYTFEEIIDIDNLFFEMIIGVN